MAYPSAKAKEAGAGYYDTPSAVHCVQPAAKPQSTGLLSKVGLAQPTLNVTLAEELLFLRPSPPGEPSEDPVLEGTVILYLPKKRVLNNLTVRLLGRQDISFGDLRASESSISLDKEVTLNLHDHDQRDREAVLDKGEHRWDFSIIVPSSTPCHERCNWGRVKHTVTATAKGLGQLGGDVVSPAKSVVLVVNPGGAGANEPPPDLAHRYEGIVEDLGAYSISLESQHIMVGGLLLCRFFLLSPPTDIILHSIKAKVHQHFHVTSPTDPTRTATLPTDIRTVLILDGDHPPNFGQMDDYPKYEKVVAGPPLKILRNGESYRLHHLARLPHHDILRPSTFEWSESSIRIHHEIALEITYQVLPEGEEYRSRSRSRDRKGKSKSKETEPKKMVISRPLQLYACCATVDTLTLPAYSSSAELEWATHACLCQYPSPPVVKHHCSRMNLDSTSDDGSTSTNEADSRSRTIKLASGYQTPLLQDPPGYEPTPLLEADAIASRLAEQSLSNET
ncbi:hypothetical protein BCR35DRAFT_304059 [Leucosporidium creatinivorum]|uniref:Arrestin-like N-terminal domain-containing protein n=1 Tax=Leucosporidium creatinivorum TaxID=106004 RepID=A0A1Y2FBE1_9BASI|nr:hypothetical protein BCR35DRAFT_304059 [Leucosporidium creatinivorum]